MDYKELIQKQKELANSLMNGDSPKEVIDAVGKLNEGLDELAKEHENVSSRLRDMTEAYIASKKQEGSSEQPKQEATEESKPKTLQEIAQELVNKEQK